MKKLVSMTDFVLNETNNFFNDRNYEPSDLATNLNNYANFLKQPLTLSMFIPTDENGVVLEFEYSNNPISLDDRDYQDALEIFEQAKSKVIFEGFEYDQKLLFLNGELFWVFEKNDFTFDNKTIEYLIPYNLTLTDKI